MNIKVLGLGCPSCHKQYEIVRAAVEEGRIPAEVEYITDWETVMRYGVMGMPAVVLDGAVISAGRILTKAELVKRLQQG